MKATILITFCLLPATVTCHAQSGKSVPLTARVNVQADSARTNQIIDGRWVAVGTNKPHTLQLDYTRLFLG